MTHHSRPGIPYWTCEPCGKRAYPTRKDARQAARTTHPTTGRLHPYPCPATGHGYHVGQMPTAMKNGDIDRATYEANRTPNAYRHQKEYR